MSRATAISRSLAPAPTPAPTQAAEVAPPPRPSRSALPAVLGVMLLTGAVVLISMKMGWPRAAPALPTTEGVSTSALVEPVVAPAPPPTVPAPTAPLASTAPLAPTAPVVTAAEAQARATLERLRSGLEGCIRKGIRALPGSSLAVPPNLFVLKRSAYTPSPLEWKTSVWSCAKFQVNEPMEFQLQWQLVRPNAEGAGVAWIDVNHDGVADRALRFSITLDPSGAPILGEILPVAPTTPVSVQRR